MNEPVLSVRDLVKHFPVRRRYLGDRLRYVHAVDGLSLDVRRTEVLGLVGESGCGKSTVGRLMLRLIEPTAGQVVFDGCNIASLPRRDLGALRRRLQIVFQDPYSSLNPRMTVERMVGEPLVIHDLCDESESAGRVADVLRKVGLGPEFMRRYPHELSGGQRQRVGIARALIVNPGFVVADEPVSSLDVSVQAQVLNLLADLKEEYRLSLVMISHNICVIQHVCDRVAVMYLGQIVELGTSDEVVMAPCHPYTEALVSAVPVPDPVAKRQRIVLRGDVASPVDPPPSCRFHTRCPHAQARCRLEAPVLREIRAEHWSACHFAEALYGA